MDPHHQVDHLCGRLSRCCVSASRRCRALLPACMFGARGRRCCGSRARTPRSALLKIDLKKLKVKQDATGSNGRSKFSVSFDRRGVPTTHTAAQMLLQRDFFLSARSFLDWQGESLGQRRGVHISDDDAQSQAGKGKPRLLDEATLRATDTVQLLRSKTDPETFYVYLEERALRTCRDVETDRAGPISASTPGTPAPRPDVQHQVSDEDDAASERWFEVRLARVRKWFQIFRPERVQDQSQLDSTRTSEVVAPEDGSSRAGGRGRGAAPPTPRDSRSGWEIDAANKLAEVRELLAAAGDAPRRAVLNVRICNYGTEVMRESLLQMLEMDPSIQATQIVLRSDAEEDAFLNAVRTYQLQTLEDVSGEPMVAFQVLKLAFHPDAELPVSSVYYLFKVFANAAAAEQHERKAYFNAWFVHYAEVKWHQNRILSPTTIQKDDVRGIVDLLVTPLLRKGAADDLLVTSVREQVAAAERRVGNEYFFQWSFPSEDFSSGAGAQLSADVSTFLHQPVRSSGRGGNMYMDSAPPTSDQPFHYHSLRIGIQHARLSDTNGFLLRPLVTKRDFNDKIDTYFRNTYPLLPEEDRQHAAYASRVLGWDDLLPPGGNHVLYEFDLWRLSETVLPWMKPPAGVGTTGTTTDNKSPSPSPKSKTSNLNSTSSSAGRDDAPPVSASSAEDLFVKLTIEQHNAAWVSGNARVQRHRAVQREFFMVVRELLDRHKALKKMKSSGCVSVSLLRKLGNPYWLQKQELLGSFGGARAVDVELPKEVFYLWVRPSTTSEDAEEECEDASLSFSAALTGTPPAPAHNSDSHGDFALLQRQRASAIVQQYAENLLEDQFSLLSRFRPAKIAPFRVSGFLQRIAALAETGVAWKTTKSASASRGPALVDVEDQEKNQQNIIYGDLANPLAPPPYGVNAGGVLSWEKYVENDLALHEPQIRATEVIIRNEREDRVFLLATKRLQDAVRTEEPGNLVFDIVKLNKPSQGQERDHDHVEHASGGSSAPDANPSKHYLIWEVYTSAQAEEHHYAQPHYKRDWLHSVNPVGLGLRCLHSLNLKSLRVQGVQPPQDHLPACKNVSQIRETFSSTLLPSSGGPGLQLHDEKWKILGDVEKMKVKDVEMLEPPERSGPMYISMDFSDQWVAEGTLPVITLLDLTFSLTPIHPSGRDLDDERRETTPRRVTTSGKNLLVFDADEAMKEEQVVPGELRVSELFPRSTHKHKDELFALLIAKRNVDRTLQLEDGVVAMDVLKANWFKQRRTTHYFLFEVFADPLARTVVHEQSAHFKQFRDARDFIAPIDRLFLDPITDPERILKTLLLGGRQEVAVEDTTIAANAHVGSEAASGAASGAGANNAHADHVEVDDGVGDRQHRRVRFSPKNEPAAVSSEEHDFQVTSIGRSLRFSLQPVEVKTSLPARTGMLVVEDNQEEVAASQLAHLQTLFELQKWRTEKAAQDLAVELEESGEDQDVLRLSAVLQDTSGPPAAAKDAEGVRFAKFHQYYLLEVYSAGEVERELPLASSESDYAAPLKIATADEHEGNLEKSDWITYTEGRKDDRFVQIAREPITDLAQILDLLVFKNLQRCGQVVLHVFNPVHTIHPLRRARIPFPPVDGDGSFLFPPPVDGDADNFLDHNDNGGACAEFDAGSSCSTAPSTSCAQQLPAPRGLLRQRTNSFESPGAQAHQRGRVQMPMLPMEVDDNFLDHGGACAEVEQGADPHTNKTQLEVLGQVEMQNEETRTTRQTSTSDDHYKNSTASGPGKFFFVGVFENDNVEGASYAAFLEFARQLRDYQVEWEELSAEGRRTRMKPEPVILDLASRPDVVDLFFPLRGGTRGEAELRTLGNGGGGE
eukprot:g11843.t1